jgi:hypothetical protein
MDVSERYEQLIAYLGAQLPAPVVQETCEDGSLQFMGGDPPEVVTRLTETSIIVSEFAGVWEEPFTFTVKPRRVGKLEWRPLPENALLAALSALIKGARDARLASFETCQYCGQPTAPEWLHEAGVCLTCAERHSGTVH